MSKKIIQKGTVQETLLIPLYGRKRAMELYPGNFNDRDCQWIFEKVEISYEKKGIMEKVGAIMAATRQYNMAERFPGGKLVFDATNKKGLKNMLKPWLKGCDENIGVYFSVENLEELKAWSPKFDSIVRKGYLTGYRPLDKRYGIILNKMFQYLDKSKMCQMIEICFG